MQTFRKLPTTVPMTKTPKPQEDQDRSHHQNTAGLPSVAWQASGRSRWPESARRLRPGVGRGCRSRHRPLLHRAGRGRQNRGDLGERARRRSARAAGRTACTSRTSLRASSSGSACEPDTSPCVRRSRRFAALSTAPPPVARIAPGMARRRARGVVRSSQSRNTGSPQSAKIERIDRPARASISRSASRNGRSRRSGQDLADRRLARAAVADQGQSRPAIAVTACRSGVDRHSSRMGPSLRLEGGPHHLERGVLARVELELEGRLAEEHVDAGDRLGLALARQLEQHRVLGMVHRVEDHDARARERRRGKRRVVEVGMHPDRSAVDDHVGDDAGPLRPGDHPAADLLGQPGRAFVVPVGDRQVSPAASSGRRRSTGRLPLPPGSAPACRAAGSPPRRLRCRPSPLSSESIAAR